MQMEKTFTLTLTEQQLEMLGYALTVAKRSLEGNAPKMVTETTREQAAKIEDLRCIVDVCPESKAA
jgi:hypothetical protein